jgi:holliday junction DNA helicase RuvA
MIDYIKGEISELTPTYVVVETMGVGYFIHISLPTYTQLTNSNTTKLYVYEVIREDSHSLYGFQSKLERQLFLLLISVSGIGANTARMIMSSYSVTEIQQMIANGDERALNAIKGIGIKTAQRIIVELKDKIIKTMGVDISAQVSVNNQVREESVSALVMLGFTQALSQKCVDNILQEQPTITLEQLIKLALKMM